MARFSRPASWTSASIDDVVGRVLIILRGAVLGPIKRCVKIKKCPFNPMNVYMTMVRTGLFLQREGPGSEPGNSLLCPDVPPQFSVWGS